MVRLLAPLLLLAASVAAAPPTATDIAEATRQLSAAESAFAKSMADRDFEAFASFIAEDAVFVNGSNPLRGKAAVLADWKQYFVAPAAPFSWHPEHAIVLDAGTWGQTKGPVLDPAGKVFAHFRSTWRQASPGVWQVVFDDGYLACPCAPKEGQAMKHVEGAFDVTLTPQAADPRELGAAIGEMLLDKQFHGALEARSEGRMLAFRSAVEGSAGYVAMERVSGTLEGRKGSFVLQHSGTMDRGAQRLDLSVVPDSGTGELAGLSGRMAIDISDGKHAYRFDYQLPATP